MTGIILRGCNGRMGRVITEMAAASSDMEIVAGIDIFDEGKNSYPVFKSLAECDVKADVLIDFSSPNELAALLDAAIERKLAAVLCSTGYSQEDIQLIEAASSKIAILRSANMSLGVNTLIMLLKAATQVLSPAGYDIEIVEKHHNQKLDAPSGTALLLADRINEAAGGIYNYRFDRSTERAKRPANEIGISAVRGGSIVGEHEVLFAGVDEVIEIKHTAYSRSIFAKGAVEAARYLAGKPAGMYSMENVVER